MPLQINTATEMSCILFDAMKIPNFPLVVTVFDPFPYKQLEKW